MKFAFSAVTLSVLSLVLATPLHAQDPGVDQYATFRLTTDLAQLSATEREMLPHLIAAAELMDDLFWRQAYGGDRDELLTAARSPEEREYLLINYGPWDRLDADAPFVPGVGPKPAGANFYPSDMTRDEFEATAAEFPELRGLYALVRRDEAGHLVSVPYHVEYRETLEAAANHIRIAAEITTDPELRHYLQLRADALLTDDFQPSDLAWMDMKNNHIEFVVGPIETYEDQLFGYKAAYEAYVLVKDMEWSRRLQRFAALLPRLQEGLPVDDHYRSEVPGTDSDLNAYDAIYYAGDANAGTKTIAINLPNDEEVQLQRGTRRLQLKNAMQAKFDSVLVPIAEMLIAEDQRQYVTFDAFFANTMFHEVAHGLGIKNTINGHGTVRQALREHASALEEGKADVLGLYMVTRLFEWGELEGDVRDHYVTFLASIFRSVRFGASSAHGRANMIRFNFFEDAGAFTRDAETGTYSVDFPRMEQAMTDLSSLILTLQGDGNYGDVDSLVTELGIIRPGLAADLERLAAQGIPVDIVFEQGMEGM